MPTTPTLGRVAFDGYGEAGRTMPRWDALNTPAGDATRLRWEAGTEAAVRAYCQRTGLPFIPEALMGEPSADLSSAEQG
jgi:hypothetical protein